MTLLVTTGAIYLSIYKYICFIYIQEIYLFIYTMYEKEFIKSRTKFVFVSFMRNIGPCLYHNPKRQKKKLAKIFSGVFG